MAAVDAQHFCHALCMVVVEDVVADSILHCGSNQAEEN
jgi:hypothetical protein